MTTLKPLTGRIRRDCTRCWGTAKYRAHVDGKTTKVFVCAMCKPRVEDGRLEVRGSRLVEPRRVKAKRTGES